MNGLSCLCLHASFVYMCGAQLCCLCQGLCRESASDKGRLWMSFEGCSVTTVVLWSVQCTCDIVGDPGQCPMKCARQDQAI